jgi:predicted secreted Zn-dependent protease
MALRRTITVMGLALTAGTAPAALPDAAASRLATFPNTTIEYYDVEGATVTAINRSIRAQRGTGASGKAKPAETSWDVKVDFAREMIGGRCTVRDARVDMTARAELPRLIDGEKLTAAERARWADYVALLEQGSAATLAFVHENLEQVEAAIEGSTCDGARAAGTAAVEALRTHANRLSTENEKRLASLSEFRPAMLADAKLVCRDLKATGGRLRTVRTCLPAREWERLWKSSAAFTQDVVSKFSKSSRVPF